VSVIRWRGRERERERERPTLFCPLERTNLNHWTQVIQQSWSLPPLSWIWKQTQFPKRRVF
jgi:hypothetical protein